MDGRFGIKKDIKERFSEIHERCTVSSANERHIFIHGLHDWCYTLVISRNNPIWRTLENYQTFGDFGDLWYDLCSSCTVANDANLLITKVVVPIPSGRVHRLALERINSLDIWVFRNIQLTHSGD